MSQNIARFIKYVLPFFNIIYERVKSRENTKKHCSKINTGINPFLPVFLFDTPESRKPKVFWCFQEDQKGTLGGKELNG